MNEFESLELGDSASEGRTITSDIIHSFAAVSGDHNPVHVDAEFASNSFFRGTIAHGMLVASLISSIIGNKLPGHGAIYLSQTLNFTAPVRPNDEVTATVVVTKLDKTRGRLSLKTEVVNQKGQIVVTGEAELVMSSYLKKQGTNVSP